MSRTFWAGIFSVLLVTSIVMGVYSTLTLPPVEGFGQADLLAPGTFSPEALPPLPDIAGDTTARPDVSVMIYIGQIFVDYGGAVRVDVVNNGTRAMFLEELSFDWVGTGDSYQSMVNAEIASGETHAVKALAIEGPAYAGQHDYQLRLRMLQNRNDGWYRVISGGDEWLSFSEHTIDVLDLANVTDVDVAVNTRMYFERVNTLVDPDSEAVANATLRATAGMGGGFDMGKACAIFDYLDENINYTEDEGGDKWYSPDRTLDTRTGDCEDYAMLLAAMVDNAGGTARVYLTVDHAFAAVYVGNSSGDLDDAIADVRAYYGTGVEVHAITDDSGRWMVADPLGSFYMGGPAVGQAPAGLQNGSWNMTFEETELLYSIDVTGNANIRPMWLDSSFWMGMMLLTGFCALGFTVAAMSDRPLTKTYCHICAGEVAGDLYTCPTCKTTYHRECAFSKAYCMTCQKPIVYPAPPPPRNP